MRKDRLYLTDICDACRKIERYTAGKSFADFANDEILIDAVVRNLQIIGEAVRTLPQETRDLRPETEWKQIVGVRHLLVHQYFGIDDEIVWDLAVNRCPELHVIATELLERIQ